MSKYSISATKADYEKVYDEIRDLEQYINYDLDWKKIKRTSLDNLAFLVTALKREIKKNNSEKNNNQK